MLTRPVTTPTACPNPQTLRELLCERLSQDETEAVESHVSLCLDCQRALQQLVGSMPGELGPLLESRGQTLEAEPDLPGYALLGRIDAGGMGVVWRARDLEFQRTLAVKVMKSDARGNPNAVRRFLTETQITGQLAHPSIVPVHARGWLPDGRPYFTMKLVEGETLATLLQGRSAPADRLMEMVRVFSQVCQAVAYAHKRGIIHRDLKPANVMVGEFGEVQVMDWGLAKVLSAEKAESCPSPGSDTVVGSSDPLGTTVCDPVWDTQQGVVMGTLPYMPPEQARGEVTQLDARCDVFNLGAILCEILTGEPPYRSESREEVLRQAANGELADAFARLDSCSADAELVRLAKVCLTPNQDSRTPDASIVASGVVAYQTSVEQRLRQAEVERAEAQVRVGEERKRRRLATGLVAVVLLAVCGLAVAVVLLNQAHKRAVLERDLAEAYGRRTSSVLDLMTSSLTGESLEMQPDITPEQRTFLANVLNYYQEIASEAGDNEVKRKRIAGAAYRVGLINYRLGFRDTGIEATKQARDRYRSLADDFPAEPEYRQDLAHCHTNLGLLLRELGQRAEADTEFQQALTIRQKLVDEHSGVPRYRHDLANAHHNIGLLQEDSGDRPTAESSHRQALAIREKLDAEFPNDPLYQRNLASSYTTLANLFHVLGNHSDAEKAYDASIAIQEKLLKRFPDKLQDSRDLAVSYNNLGGLLRKLSRRPEAAEKYQKALAIQKKLVAQFPAVPKYQRDMASSYNNLGAVFLEQKKHVEAEDALRQSLAVREKLNADFPGVPEHRRELASSHNNLGILLKQLNRRPEAEKSYRSALEIRVALAAEYRQVPEYRRDLGIAYNNLAVLLRELKKLPDAEEAYRQAIAIRTELATQYPESPNYEHELANTYNNLGILLREQKKRPEAEDAYRKALASQEKLFAKHPRVAEYGQDIAMSHFNLGNLYYEYDKFAEAEAAFLYSVAAWDKLAAEFPKLTENRGKHGTALTNLAMVRAQRGKAAESLELFEKAISYLKPQSGAQSLSAADRRLLANAYRGRAKTLVVLKRFSDAVVDWDRTVELLSGSESGPDRASRARALVLAGLVERAVAEAKALITPQADARLLYQMAAIHALAAERDEKNRERHAQNALQLLRRAVDSGFKDANYLKKDSDLTILHDHEEYRKLLVALEERSKEMPVERKK